MTDNNTFNIPSKAKMKINSKVVSRTSRRRSSHQRKSTRSSSNTVRPQNFNRMIANMFQQVQIKRPSRNSPDYESSFRSIQQFSQQISDDAKQSITCVIFNAEKSDGILSAYAAWRYAKDHQKSLRLFGGKPASGSQVDFRLKKMESDLRGQVILVLDISYSDANIHYLEQIGKTVYQIDDHSAEERNITMDRRFIGTNHAACAYTWKFYYPDRPVPRFIQYIDSDDHKLFLPTTPHTSLFAITMGIRYGHLKTRNYAPIMEELHDLVEEDKPEMFIVIGYYYDQIRASLVKQIAINYQVRSFQGHRVGILNFGSPLLSKPVGREIIEMAKQNGDDIEFVVLWLYEYTANGYRLDLIADHSPRYKGPKLNVMARELGKRGGHPRGGDGTPNGWKGNFYWPKDSRHDIWDLFDK